MDVSKLKAKRSGHRGAITRILKNISENENQKEKAGMIKVLEEKFDILQKIDNQILQELVKEEKKQTEINDLDEYMLELRIRLAELTKND